MIYELQRAHSRLQYILLIFPALMLIISTVSCVVMAIQGEDIGTLLLIFCITGTVCYGIIVFVSSTYKQVFYDNDCIYIKSMLGKPEDTLSYHDVIKLIDYAPRVYNSSQGRGAIQLSYRTEKGVATIKFMRSFYARQTDLLKRQISPDKVIE